MDVFLKLAEILVGEVKCERSELVRVNTAVIAGLKVNKKCSRSLVIHCLARRGSGDSEG